MKRKGSKTAPRESQSDELTLIRKLADMLNSTGLTEIELEKGTSRIRVSKSVSAASNFFTSAPPAAAVAMPSASGAPAVPGPAPGRAKDHSANLKSPMVGTAYLSPSPGAANFAAVGSAVKQGQTVLIIEAMKTMNQIPAHISGTITEILFDNGKPVEYGEVLMVIE